MNKGSTHISKSHLNINGLKNIYAIKAVANDFVNTIKYFEMIAKFVECNINLKSTLHRTKEYLFAMNVMINDGCRHLKENKNKAALSN